MNSLNMTKCPGCGQDVQPGWKICPFCETRLKAPACPLYHMAVQPEWKRCPGCETQLVCPRCERRIPPGHRDCPDCHPEKPSTFTGPRLFADKICGLEMIYVPGGSFEMGDLFGDGLENELPLHAVFLDAYYISRYPVTQSQWSCLINENPSRFQGKNLPVEQITWDDALCFVRLLTEAYGEKHRFNLPTEAQWEFAARSGGQPEKYAGGDDIQNLAWYDDNSEGRTHPVGTKAPNGLGLFDMSGNVWEWCRDTFAVDAYQRHAPHNPVMNIEGSDRVIRGGSWNLDAWSTRCSRRFSFRTDLFGSGLGFRLVLAV